MLSPREAEVVKGLNSYRASKGLKALKVRGDLVAQSRSWSGVMAAQNNLYHSNYNVWETIDRKSTRLNSSHVSISYAVFCLKKKSPESAHNGGWRPAIKDQLPRRHAMRQR